MPSDRRSVLSGIGSAALLGLAGCIGGGGDGDDTTTPGNVSGDPTTTTPNDTTTTTPENTTTTTTTLPDPGERLTNPSFESDLEGWTVGTDLPDDPNKEDGGKVDHDVEATGHSASEGDQSLAVTIDGSQDDGTVWVQQEVDLTDVSTLSVDYLTSAGGANVITKAAVYAGPVPEDSLTETDFHREKALQRSDGGDWQTFEWDVDHDGTGLVAVGITVVWETEVTNFLDDVQLA